MDHGSSDRMPWPILVEADLTVCRGGPGEVRRRVLV